MARVSLIVGLGNPGPKYEATRHNAGFWLINQLARENGAALKTESRFHGETGKVSIAGHEVLLLKPTTFMNRSGLAVRALAQFYKIEPEAVLVAHDEIDVPVGAVKLKQGGGNAGHNGLKDISSHLGSGNFLRLRIGVGRPSQTDPRPVVDYVLDTPSRDERTRIDAIIGACIGQLPVIVDGDIARAMNHLHAIKPPAGEGH